MGPCRQQEEENGKDEEKKVQEDIRPAASAINLCAKLSLCRMSFRGGRGLVGRMGEGASDPASKKDVNSSQLVCKNWHK